MSVSISEIQAKASAVIRATDELISHRIDGERFIEIIKALDEYVRSIRTGVEVGATADKLFRQTNLLNTSAKDIVNAVENGGDVGTYKTRVVNGTNNVSKTAQQLFEEGQQ